MKKKKKNEKPSLKVSLYRVRIFPRIMFTSKVTRASREHVLILYKIMQISRREKNTTLPTLGVYRGFNKGHVVQIFY